MRALAALAILVVLAPTASAAMSNIDDISTRGVTITFMSSYLPEVSYTTPSQPLPVAAYVPDIPVAAPVDPLPPVEATVGLGPLADLRIESVPQVQVASKSPKPWHLELRAARLDAAEQVAYAKRGALDAPASALPFDPLAAPLALASAPPTASAGPQGAPLAPEPTTDERRLTTETEGPAEPEAAWPATAAAASLGLAALLVHFLLYHRLRGSRVLDHGTRERLLAILRERPGLAPAEAARELGIDPSTALYHLRRLVKEGIAVVDGAPRANRYFATGTVAPEERARVVAERDGAPFLTLIRSEPGVSKTGLAERCAIARATVSWHLERLHRAGLVRFEREGREVKVYPAAS